MICFFDNIFTEDSLEKKYTIYSSNPNLPALVIIPGLDGILTTFQDIVPMLTPHYRVIQFYLPLLSHEMDPKDYTFTYLASELKLVLDELKIDKAVLVGESFGGIIAQHFATQYPSQTDELVLVSTISRTKLDPFIQLKVNLFLKPLQFIGMLNPGFAQTLFAHLHVGDVVEPHEPESLRSMFIKEASCAHFRSVMARINIALQLDILHSVTSKIEGKRVMCLVGADDHFTSEMSMEVCNELKKKNDVIVSNISGGHLITASNPMAVVKSVLQLRK